MNQATSYMRIADDDTREARSERIAKQIRRRLAAQRLRYMAENLRHMRRYAAYGWNRLTLQAAFNAGYWKAKARQGVQGTDDAAQVDRIAETMFRFYLYSIPS